MIFASGQTTNAAPVRCDDWIGPNVNGASTRCAGSRGGAHGVRSLQDRLTHLDLFSGIGGFALAAQEAGFVTVGFSEVDTYANQVLKRHWPDVPNLGDIRTADFSAVGTVTVLTGGFPCQPWSVAGERRGADDDRHLWPAMRDAIAKVRPAWVIAENVPGIIGMALDDVCADLEALGYSVQPFVIPACAVDARHRRDRVWIVAHAGHGLQPERTREARWQEGQWKPERSIFGRAAWWPAEPPVGRVVYGIPNGTQRLRALGNSIVPKVTLPFFDAIAALEIGGAVADARGGSAWERMSGPSEFEPRPSPTAEVSHGSAEKKL